MEPDLSVATLILERFTRIIVSFLYPGLRALQRELLLISYLVTLTLSIPFKVMETSLLWNNVSLFSWLSLLGWLPYSTLIQGYFGIRLLRRTVADAVPFQVAVMSTGTSFVMAALYGWIGHILNFNVRVLAILVSISLLIGNMLARHESSNITMTLRSKFGGQFTAYSVVFVFVILATLGTFYLYLGQPYLVPGDQWRLAKVALIDSQGLFSSGSIRELTYSYPIFGGFLVIGFSQLFGVPLVNTIVVLSILTPFLVPMVSLGLLGLIWPAGRNETVFRSFFLIFASGLGGIIYLTRIPGVVALNWWTVSYLSQDMYASGTLVTGLIFTARTTGFLLSLDSCLLLYLLVAKKNTSVGLIVLACTEVALSFLIHIEDLFYGVLPFLTLLMLLHWKERKPQANLIIPAGILVSILALDASTGGYTLSLSASKFQQFFVPSLMDFVYSNKFVLIAILVMGATFLIIIDKSARAASALVSTIQLTSSKWRRFILSLRSMRANWSLPLVFWLAGFAYWWLAVLSGSLINYPLLYAVSTGFPPFLYSVSFGLVGAGSLFAIMNRGNVGQKVWLFLALWAGSLFVASLFVYGSRIAFEAYVPLVAFASSGIQRFWVFSSRLRKPCAQILFKPLFFSLISFILLVGSLSWVVTISNFASWPPNHGHIDSAFVDVIEHTLPTLKNGTVLFTDITYAEFASSAFPIDSTLPLGNPFATNYSQAMAYWSILLSTNDVRQFSEALANSGVRYFVAPRSSIQGLSGIISLALNYSQFIYGNDEYVVVKFPHVNSAVVDLYFPPPFTYSSQGFYNLSMLGSEKSLYTSSLAQLLFSASTLKPGWQMQNTTAYPTFSQVPQSYPTLYNYSCCVKGLNLVVQSPNSTDVFYHVTWSISSMNLSAYPFLLTKYGVNDTSIYSISVVLFKGNATYPVVYGFGFPIYLKKTSSSITQLFLLPSSFANYNGPVKIDFTIWTKSNAAYKVSVQELALEQLASS